MSKPIILRETHVISNADGGTIASGRYVWKGPAGDPVFALRDSRDIVSEQIDVVCESPTEAVVVCERTSVKAQHPSTNHGFTRWRIYGNGLAERGFYFADTIDQNNEHMSISHCSFYGVRVGIVANGQQSKEHLITHCRFEGCYRAICAGSGFTMIGGAVAQASVGVELTRVGEPVTIIGTGFEACGRLMVTAGASTDAQPVTLIGCRFAADALDPDLGAIVLRHAGPLTLIGGTYGDGHQRTPRIHLQGIGEQAVSITGAKFGAVGAESVDPVVLFPGVRPSVSVTSTTYRRIATDPEHSTTRLVI